MNKLYKYWAYISVYIGAIFTLIAALGNWDIREMTLLISLTFIFLHFFEEFIFPGGFPWIGMKVELKITDTNPNNWPLNRANAMFGNWWFAVAVYFIPLFLPKVKWLTLAAVIFAFAEVLMHVIIFNFSLKKIYNPGLITALFGLFPISINYLITIWDQHLYGWQDIVIAVVWIALNYWIAFRSPIYKKLGKLKQPFSEEEVMKARRYM